MKKAYAQARRVAALGILLSSVPLLCCSEAFALDPTLDVSQYAHTAWKVRDGFAKSQIISIAQTPDGYLWLGTHFGMLRFDGVRAVPWQPPADQPLPSSHIISLLATRDGTVWIGTARGLASWKDGKLTQYPELAEQYIFYLVEDRGGSVWVGGYAIGDAGGRLCAIRKGSVHCDGDDGGLGRGVLGLYEDSKSNLWVGVLEGLWRWRPGPPKFYPLPGEPDGIQALGEDVDGTLLVGWKGGIHRFVEGKAGVYPLSGVGRQFRAHRILRDRDGGLWVGTSGHGIVHIHEGRTDVFAQSDSLSGDFVLGLFEDRESNIWVATVNGLDRFRDFAAPTFSVNQGLSSAVVGSVLADREGSIWLGTSGGLNRWNSGQIKTYLLGGKRSDPPEALFQDDRGRIWVSTVSGIGYLAKGRFIGVSGVPGGNILAIAQDRASNLWIVNEGLGLFRVSPRSEVRQFPWAALGHKDHASVLAADPSQGGLWIGFFLGGIVYFAAGQVRASYTTADRLGEGRVSGLLFDRDGTLWAATARGLSRLKNGPLATLSSKNGLPCDKVNGLTEDDDHSFWLYMACGLVRIAHPELDAWAAAINKNQDAQPVIQTTVFDSSDGVRSLVDSGHYNPQVAKSADGRLWFLPWDGVSVVDPHHLPFNKLAPPVHIEQFTADRKTYYDSASAVTVDANRGVRLPALSRDLQIDYTALSLVVPEKVMFRYKLEGYDRDWVDAGNRRQAFYTNLPPKNYTFRVKACNNSGVWNEAGTSLDFAVAPAYYQAPWFRLSCVAAFLALLVGLYRLRLRQLAQQFNRTMEARVGERTRIARELHDTLLQGLHGLMFQFQAARNMLPNRPQQAIETLDGALDATEQAIAESRAAIHDLREEAASSADLAESLKRAAEELADSWQAKSPVPAFQLIREGERKALDPVLRDEVYRIAREVLRNAFQHAGGDRIEAEIHYDAEVLRLRIRDNGRGIDPEILKAGGRPGHWGLRGVRERAQRIGAQLDFWSDAGAGTEVQLKVPAKVAYEGSGDGAKRRARTKEVPEKKQV